MTKIKLIFVASAAALIALTTVGCSLGPKDSNAANNNWTPAKAGMNHDQFMAKFHQAMASGQIGGATKTSVPQGAINAGAIGTTAQNSAPGAAPAGGAR